MYLDYPQCSKVEFSSLHSCVLSHTVMLLMDDTEVHLTTFMRSISGGNIMYHSRLKTSVSCNVFKHKHSPRCEKFSVDEHIISLCYNVPYSPFSKRQYQVLLPS